MGCDHGAGPAVSVVPSEDEATGQQADLPVEGAGEQRRPVIRRRVDLIRSFKFDLIRQNFGLVPDLITPASSL